MKLTCYSLLIIVLLTGCARTFQAPNPPSPEQLQVMQKTFSGSFEDVYASVKKTLMDSGFSITQEDKATGAITGEIYKEAPTGSKLLDHMFDSVVRKTGTSHTLSAWIRSKQADSWTVELRLEEVVHVNHRTSSFSLLNNTLSKKNYKQAEKRKINYDSSVYQQYFSSIRSNL